jgi:farnesyl diphosphate synthase
LCALRIQAFLQVYDKLREQLLDDSFLGSQPPAAKTWMREVREPLGLQLQQECPPRPTAPPPLLQMLDYNVPGGKLNRGMAVYDVLAALKGSEVGQRSGSTETPGAAAAADVV